MSATVVLRMEASPMVPPTASANVKVAAASAQWNAKASSVIGRPL